MAVNADEGEPGTFKDRWFMERDPHRFLEGMLIAGWAVEAETIYIYLRDEYPDCRQILRKELPELEAAGLFKPGAVHLRRGAGAYICGEESAMLESIEGKRGLPRHKPPFPAQIGLFGRPTLIHNVETLYWIRDLVQKGPDWFTSQGRNGAKGLRTFSVSGRVKKPGVKIAEAGITVRQLIDEYCGGMADGHSFKGYLPGGASGGILPASMGDVPLDFGTLEQYGCLIGSAAGNRCPVGPGFNRRCGDQSAEIFRRRKLRSVYAVPQRLRKGGPAAAKTKLGRAIAGGIVRRHAGCLDLRSRPGRP